MLLVADNVIWKSKIARILISNSEYEKEGSGDLSGAAAVLCAGGSEDETAGGPWEVAKERKEAEILVIVGEQKWEGGELT